MHTPFQLSRSSVSLAAALWLIPVAVLVPNLAHAYLDPGTGSYVIQIAVGLIFGGAYTFKRFIAAAVTKLRGGRQAADQTKK